MEQVTVQDIAKTIEAFAPLAVQEDWDNSGLAVGSPGDPVHGVLLALDCTPELVDEAVGKGMDMIVTHHPLIFRGLKKISPDDPVGLAVMKAVRAGVSIYAAHTNADKVREGVSWAMASRLSLTGVRVLDGQDGVGLGVVGQLPQPMSAQEVIRFVKERFSLQALRTSRPVSTAVETVALCGGSGGSLIGAARAAGAQLYVSADISYHNFFTPDGFMVMDIGHFESEVDIVDILFSLLRKKFPNFAVRISDNLHSSNPIFYY